MLITRIELENIKSYKKMVVDFRRGTTAISGANGAGKTTLVESIGYALFDYLPYKQEQFIREGEKFGSVTVHLIGGDDRPYTVERRCGSRSRWFIYDEEAHDHVDQKTDVLDKLHDLFGIDRERPLDSLFRDALGVPQGTFTAIFLDKPASRNQTFNALLQIEDYKTAFDKLLETQRLYKEQMMSQQGVIQRLEYETRDLDAWHNTLSEAQQQREQQERQSIEWSQLLVTLREQHLALKEQERTLDTLGKQRDYCNATYTNAQNLLREREYQAQVAREAQRIIEASRNDYQRYREADATLVRLRKDEQQRSRLLKQQSDLNSNHARVESNEQNWLSRLEEVERARQQVAMLTPLVEQQNEHEKKRDVLIEQKAHYDEILERGKSLRKRVEGYQQKQAQLRKQIAEIEPLEPVANLFEERNERLHSLMLQSSERLNKQRQLQEKQNELESRNRERDMAADKLRKAEANIATIEEHRSEAEEMPHLETRRVELIAQEHRVTGNIEGYVKSRAQSAGGQCPLLNEGCLNIRQRGMVSLESYFDGLLTDEHRELDKVRAEQATITRRTDEIKKYVDWFNRLGTYTERRDNYVAELQRLAIDIARLEREIANVAEEVDSLKQLPALIEEAQRANQESKDASLRVRELPGLHKQVQQLQEQIEQGNEELETLRAEIAHLKGVDTFLEQVKASLVKLNNPRLRCQTQQNIVDKAPTFEQSLSNERTRKAELEQQLQALEQQLKSYATLDNDIQQQEAIRISSGEGYQNYLKHAEVARLLPQREEELQQQSHVTEDAQHQAEVAEQAYQEAFAAFDPQQMIQIEGEISRLGNELATLQEQTRHLQDKIRTLEQQIERAEVLMQELDEARKEQQMLDELRAMIEQFRGYIKEAGPYVLKAMLADISAEANRIFGEIMGDRSAQLSWQNDYEIVLRRQGASRTFAQLSGGEQMSAALAVRLALLKKLSTLNLAFFDEPTQNMDELRRMNLAEQIRRVRGFDQLIVISHDDTFEQGLDSIVRLSKEGGETHIVGEEESREREQVHSYAS